MLQIRPAQRRDRRRALPPTLSILLQALEVRDPLTAAHCRRVAALCHHVAEVLDLPAADSRTLHHAASLHDIGKLGIDDAILFKPGRLSLDEHLAMQRHPAIGAALLQRHWPDVATIVRSHHENVDGTGYPDGLTGTQIPLASRIIAVCDSWDAMTTDRPYRQGMDHAFAAKILREGAGGQWDATVVAVLPEIVSSEGYRSSKIPSLSSTSIMVSGVS